MRIVFGLIVAFLMGGVFSPPAAANPMKGECRQLYRDYLKQPSNRAFASTRNKQACGWAGGYGTQAQADREALKFCRKHGSCYILTNSKSEREAKAKTEDAKKVQRSLNAAGYNVGKVDGDIGPATRSAIKKFQRSIRESATGFLTASQKKKLYAKVVEDRQKEVKKLITARAFSNSKGFDAFATNDLRDTLLGIDTGQAMTLWDTKAAHVIFTQKGQFIAGALDGKANFAVLSEQAQSAWVLNLKDGSRTNLGTGTGASAVAMSVDGTRIAFGMPDGTLKVLDRQSFDVKFEINTGAKVQKIRFDPVNTAVLVLSESGSLQARDYETGRLIRDYLGQTPRDVTDFQFGKYGRAFVYGTQSGNVVSLKRAGAVFTQLAQRNFPHPVEAIDVFERRDQVVIASSTIAQVLDAKTLVSDIRQRKTYLSTNMRVALFADGQGRLILPRTGGLAYLYNRNGADDLDYKKRKNTYIARAKARATAAKTVLLKAQAAARNRRNAAAALFGARDCDGFAQTQQADRNGRTVAQCETLAAQEKRGKKIEEAIAGLRCDRAERLDVNQGYANSIASCRAKVQRAADEDAFATAMATGDCDTVVRLGPTLGQKDAAATCAFNTVMTSDSARRMYLAAATYEAKREREKAKLIYLEIMSRFPEEDLAIQAATRITSISDMDVNEEKQRQLEAEVAKAKATAATARAAAAKAQAEAEQAKAAAAARSRAQAEEQRRANARRSEIESNKTACAHLYVNKDVGYTFFGMNHYVVRVDRERGDVWVKNNQGTKRYRCYQINK